MGRPAVNLSEEELAELEAMAQKEGTTIEALLHGAVQSLLQARNESWEARRRKALQVVGSFDSGASDVSSRHDDYLADSFAS